MEDYAASSISFNSTAVILDATSKFDLKKRSYQGKKSMSVKVPLRMEIRRKTHSGHKTMLFLQEALAAYQSVEA